MSLGKPITEILSATRLRTVISKLSRVFKVIGHREDLPGALSGLSTALKIQGSITGDMLQRINDQLGHPELVRLVEASDEGNVLSAIADHQAAAQAQTKHAAVAGGNMNDIRQRQEARRQLDDVMASAKWKAAEKALADKPGPAGFRSALGVLAQLPHGLPHVVSRPIAVGKSDYPSSRLLQLLANVKTQSSAYVDYILRHAGTKNLFRD
jgi:hypothetical protein